MPKKIIEYIELSIFVSLIVKFSDILSLKKIQF